MNEKKESGSNFYFGNNRGIGIKRMQPEILHLKFPILGLRIFLLKNKELSVNTKRKKNFNNRIFD